MDSDGGEKITLKGCISLSLMSCVSFFKDKTEERERKEGEKNRQEGKNNFLFEQQSDFVLVNLQCTPR